MSSVSELQMQGDAMFGFFSSDPIKKIENQIKKKYTQSVQLQRSGKIKEYGRIMKEIEGLEEKLERLRHES